MSIDSYLRRQKTAKPAVTFLRACLYTNFRRQPAPTERIFDIDRGALNSVVNQHLLRVIAAAMDIMVSVATTAQNMSDSVPNAVTWRSKALQLLCGRASRLDRASLTERAEGSCIACLINYN